MKRVIAGVVAGLLLGACSTAFAQTFWNHEGRTYRCKGGPVSFFCTETNWDTNYKLALYPGGVAVSYGQSLIFHCKRKRTPEGNCIYRYGP